MTKLTFKRFISESLPSPNNVDGAFNVGNVAFDNKEGLGNTPMGKNVQYRGAVAWIKISTFRALAIDADRSGDAAKIAALMRNETKIAAPFLDIDIIGEPEAPELVKVTGHEGRARAEAVKLIDGDVYIPVQLHPSGLRARNLSASFFKWIETHGIQAERSTKIVKPNAKMYYWNGQEIVP